MKYEETQCATNDISPFWFVWKGARTQHYVGHALWLLLANTFRFITLIHNTWYILTIICIHLRLRSEITTKHRTHKGCDLALGMLNCCSYALSLIDSRGFRFSHSFSVGRILFNWIVLTFMHSYLQTNFKALNQIIA